MSDTGAEIVRALEDEGLAVCTLHADAVVQILQTLGEIVEETEVRQHDGVDTYLAGRAAVPLHTDHPEAQLVAWRCEVQDTQDGASLLADGHSIIRMMGARADSLRGVHLQVPPQLPRQKLDRGPVWDGSRLYYAPWYRVMVADEAGRSALAMFANMLAMGYGHRRIRLQPGEVLIVDNGRWLHGRDELPRNSPRRLRRWWLGRC